jgi:hypothetical protein
VYVLLTTTVCTVTLIYVNAIAREKSPHLNKSCHSQYNYSVTDRSNGWYSLYISWYLIFYYVLYSMFVRLLLHWTWTQRYIYQSDWKEVGASLSCSVGPVVNIPSKCLWVFTYHPTLYTYILLLHAYMHEKLHNPRVSK